jgi:putative transferase (TIGR04331 family)
MFLITTADQRFWRTDEPVLFLGEWCKLFSQRHVYEKLQHEILPYHWDDRRQLYKDYIYLNNLYEKVLDTISINLNEIHDVDYSKRYWRIIIGPWLYYFIHILYDRYKSIIDAVETERVTDTIIAREEPGRWISEGYTEFNHWAVYHDEYNHYLYSRIVEYIGKVPFRYSKGEINNITKKKNVDIKQSNKEVFKLSRFLVSFYQDHIPARFNKIVFIASCFDTWDIIKLQLSLRQLPYLTPPKVKYPDLKTDISLREELDMQSDNEFEELLGKLIMKQIPSLYLENYKKMSQAALNAYPKLPKLILTGNAFDANETFKFWAAYHVERGVKLVGTQHGGHYGTCLWSTIDDHLIKIYDRFYTWGWSADNCDNTIPMSAVQLNRVKMKVHHKKEGRFLMVSKAISRYARYVYSGSIAAKGHLDYLEDGYSFVSALSEENKRKLLIRLYRNDFEWLQKERWFTKFPEIECYSGSKSFPDQLSESILCICTYNATAYLETFAADFPTIVFWKPEHWELSSSAEPYFEKIREVGILHNTPDSAAKKVNEISHDPLSWWQQPEIQEAKDQFCSQFARTSDNWLKEWKSELMNMVK